jgi:hypothetical protein
MSSAAPAVLPVPTRVIRRRTRRRNGRATSKRLHVRPASPWQKGDVERFFNQCVIAQLHPSVRRVHAEEAAVSMPEIQRPVRQGVVHIESWPRLGFPERMAFYNARREAFHV